MSNTNIYKGENLSFFELLEKHYVEIPIIQRDYAQGRKDKEEIRVKFLDALFSAIEENKNIKLDFIYGSDVEGVFQPLDGQQRLTTLFLLHWYATTISTSPNDKVLERLSKFSYETRITSRDFCKALIGSKIQINKDSELSTQIIDSSWFYLSWKKDPTIDSMLRTIDDIHKLFFNTNNLLEKLTSSNERSSLISFHYVELKDIGLTDDLYIKMNARGSYYLHLKILKQASKNILLITNGKLVVSLIIHLYLKLIQSGLIIFGRISDETILLMRH